MEIFCTSLLGVIKTTCVFWINRSAKVAASFAVVSHKTTSPIGKTVPKP